MIEQAIKRLEDLARTDPTVAPLVALEAVARSAAREPAWEAEVPGFDRQRLLDGLPLLHGQVIRVDAERVRALLVQLSRAAAQQASEGAEPLRRAIERSDLDPLIVLEASIVQDGERLGSLADAVGLDGGLLATLGQLMALPLLQACGRKAAPLLADIVWEAGYCPVCAAWPTLAELRGLDRARWLRCGRCGSGWIFPHERCSFCDNLDHRTRGYLAPEADRETRRAVTCDVCGHYLKTMTTLAAIPPGDLAAEDLLTLPLDLAAMEQGYRRPAERGFPLELRLERTARSTGWLGWRR